MLAGMMFLLWLGGQCRQPGHVTEKPPAIIVDVNAQLCPVNDGKPLKSMVALYNQRLYHFCSKPCVNAFNKDPQSYLRKLAFVREVPLRTTNPDGLDPINRRPIRYPRKPLFAVQGSTITFYSSPETIAKGTQKPLDESGREAGKARSK